VIGCFILVSHRNNDIFSVFSAHRFVVVLALRQQGGVLRLAENEKSSKILSPFLWETSMIMRGEQYEV